MRFITLTDDNGDEVIVDSNRIITISTRYQRAGSVLKLEGAQFDLSVRESTQTVVNRINKES